MPRRPVRVPDKYLARPEGIFTLRGGPLCGLWTNRAPGDDPVSFGVQEFYWQDARGVTWLLAYRFDPDLLLYMMEGQRTVAFA